MHISLLAGVFLFYYIYLIDIKICFNIPERKEKKKKNKVNKKMPPKMKN